MSTRIDRATVSMDVYVEFEGRRTVAFDLPTDHWLVSALREWHERKLLDDAVAELGQSGIPGIG